MTNTIHSLENNEQIAGTCTIPFPKGDENTTRLVMRYSRAFSHILKKKQYVVVCNLPVSLARAITLGAWTAGFPVAYLNPSIPKAHLNEVLSKLGNTLNIGSPDCLASLENKDDWLSPDPDGAGDNNLFARLQSSPSEDPIVPYEWHDDECASVTFTSGSTGRPKGVCHSIGNLTRSAEHFIGRYFLGPNDRMLATSPVFALSGLLMTMVSLVSGCKLIESPKEPTLKDFLNLFQSERPTVFVCGPMVFRQIARLADKLDDELSSIRLLLSTGAKLDRSSRIQFWEKHHIPVLDSYGMTEVTYAIGEPMDHYKPELEIIGRPFPDITVEIIEVEGMSAPELTVGQIRIHSPNLFLGYLGEPLARKRYFNTGDLGMIDEAGNVSLKGRLDHGVKSSSGLWLFPQAVEQLLVNRSDIADAYVRSGYDKYDRGVLRAKVVPSDPNTVDKGWLKTLSQDIEDQLGPDYKAVDIEIASVIPRTALGKIIKELN